MKKLLMSLTALLLVLCLAAGCGSQEAVTVDFTDDDENETEDVIKAEEEPEPEEEKPEEQEEQAEPVTVSDTDFEVTDYLYEDDYGNVYAFFVVQNNSEAAVEIAINAIAKDADGNELGVEDAGIDIVGAGEQSICYAWFYDVGDVESVEYTMEYGESYWYEPVLSGLSVEQTENEENVVLAVTNNADVSAQFVLAVALFMDADDNVIGYDNCYISDDNSEIKPGSTLYAELSNYESYDHVLVYFSGETDGYEADMSDYVDNDSFEIEEYAYENGGWGTYYILAVTNNSDEAVYFYGNAVAKDASGRPVGAADAGIDVLGPGEQSICYFYFMGVDGIDTVEYQYMGSTNLFYDPVIANLSVEQTVNNKNVILSITNNGEYAAEFVEAYALFFDADGNIITISSTYFTDDDSEIKVGETITEELDAYQTFDSVQVYLTGRHYQG